jgi:hypothetical protein
MSFDLDPGIQPTFGSLARTGLALQDAEPGT